MKGKTLIKYITAHPLAILPSYLDVVVSAIQEWPDGKLLSVEGSSGAAEPQLEAGGIKVLKYNGTVMKKTTGLEALSGGISTQQVQKDLEAAINDPKVTGIVLSLDSPGGTVDGTKELADYIMSVRGKKPIVAYADGLMASAAYWIGCCADAIVAYDTTQVGSIGVIMTHFDYSGQAEKEGIKPTVMRAGKYKALGNRYEPLSKEAKELFQEDLDYYYSMFVDHVAEARGVDTNVVLGVMAEGRVFIGHKAKEAGLIDHIGGIEKAIQLTLELGGKNVEKKVQEALKSGALPEVLSTLADRDDLPADVKATIQTALTPVEKVEVEKSHYDSMVAELDELKAKLTETEAHLEEAQGKIEALENQTAQKAKEDAVKALFADSNYELTDELMATLLEMEIDQAKVVADNLIATKADADKIASTLLQDGDGTNDATDSNVPMSIDDAVKLVEADNPDMSIEEVIAEANKQYPELFKRK